MTEPLKGHFFISSYDPTLQDAKEQFSIDIRDASFDKGKWQLWRVERTEYGMNFVITFSSNRKYRESDKLSYLELIDEVDTRLQDNPKEGVKE